MVLPKQSRKSCLVTISSQRQRSGCRAVQQGPGAPGVFTQQESCSTPWITLCRPTFSSEPGLGQYQQSAPDTSVTAV